MHSWGACRGCCQQLQVGWQLGSASCNLLALLGLPWLKHRIWMAQCLGQPLRLGAQAGGLEAEGGELAHIRSLLELGCSHKGLAVFKTDEAVIIKNTYGDAHAAQQINRRQIGKELHQTPSAGSRRPKNLAIRSTVLSSINQSQVGAREQGTLCSCLAPRSTLCR